MAYLWGTLGILLIALEVLAGGFVVVLLGLGFLAGSVGAVAGFGIREQVAIIVLATGVATLTVRPTLTALFPKASDFRSNTEALLEATGVVTEALDPRATSGRVRIAAEEWRARPCGEAAIDAGIRVIVRRVEGNTVYVERI